MHITAYDKPIIETAKHTLKERGCTKINLVGINHEDSHTLLNFDVVYYGEYHYIGADCQYIGENTVIQFYNREV